MKEQVIKLDKKKAYDLSKLNDNQIQKVAEFVFKNKHENQTSWNSVEKIKDVFIKYNENHILKYFKDEDGDMIWGAYEKNTNSKKNITDAQTLFNNEAWQPKQGDKVLVSNDGFNYREREYIGLTSENKYLCWYERKTNARTFRYVKPYEDEIKLGDWVKSENGNHVYKVTSEQSGFKNWIKITDEDLIERLKNL